MHSVGQAIFESDTRKSQFGRGQQGNRRRCSAREISLSVAQFVKLSHYPESIRSSERVCDILVSNTTPLFAFSSPNSQVHANAAQVSIYRLGFAA